MDEYARQLLDFVDKDPVAKQFIAANSRDAIKLNMRPGNSGALSFLGGAPLLPRNLVWPRDDDTGTASLFYGQIHLPDLPETHSPAMPREGILYFFGPAGYADPTWAKILYATDTSDLVWAEPAVPELHISDNRRYLSARRGKADDAIVGTEPFDVSRFPRFELDFVGYRSIRGLNWEGALALQGLSDEDEDDTVANTMDGLSTVDEVNQQEANRSFYGDRYDHLFGSPDDQRSGLRQMLESGFASDAIPLLCRDWPHAWISIGLAVRQFFEMQLGLAPQMRSLLPQQESLHDELLGDCMRWASRARESGPYTAVSAEDRQEFRTWLAASHGRLRELWKEADDRAKAGRQRGAFARAVGRLTGTDPKIDSDIAYLFQLFLYEFDTLDFNSSKALASCLDADNQAAGFIAADVAEAFWPRMTRNFRHHMFGYDGNVENGSDRAQGRTVLLQLDSCPLMDWQFGDSDCLIFWIDQDDLAAGRFNRVEMSVDGT